MKKIEKNSSYRVYKTSHYNGSYLLLLRKRKLPSFEISRE